LRTLLPSGSALFPYTTLFRSGLGVGVAEQEGLAQALAGEVDLGAVHQRQAGGVHEDAHPVLLEHGIAVALVAGQVGHVAPAGAADRKSTRLNSSHVKISYAVF